MSNTRPTILPGFNRILHGGDYNPDQWQHAPEAIDDDFRLMKLAGCKGGKRGQGSSFVNWLGAAGRALVESRHGQAVAQTVGEW